MGSSTASIVYCEHDEVEAACLDCLAKPKKIELAPPPTPRATKSPTSSSDKISPLTGDLDVSIPCVAPQDLIGASTISARVFPHYLRRGGWVYLRTSDYLQARVKATGITWQEQRQDLVDLSVSLGPGIVFEVDPNTWDADLAIPLGSQAQRQRDGYRYLLTGDDDSIIHYWGGRPIVETDQVDIDLRD